MNNLLYALFGFEKNKSKTYVFFIVLIHVCIWSLLFLLPFLFYPVRFGDKSIFLREAISKVFLVGMFYVNYYLLLPRLFERKKYLIYFLLILSAIILAVVQDIVVREKLIGSRPFVIRMEETMSQRINENPMGDFFGPLNDSVAPPPPLPLFEHTIWGVPRRMLFMSLNKVISFSLILFLIGGLIRLSLSFIKNQNEKKVLENENLNAEINSLKAQINPHFLFNTLNGIYSLAHTGSKQTEITILKLSDLMRYVLYESGTEKVELKKDIQYISNYIDLQRLRLSSKVTIQYTVQGDTDNYYIAPLLLMSFLENAFKHGISYTRSSLIRIEITVFEGTLTLLVENPFIERNSFAPGVGLKNATRRLELLYPHKHSLNITNGEGLYTVNLKLDLK